MATNAYMIMPCDAGYPSCPLGRMCKPRVRCLQREWQGRGLLHRQARGEDVACPVINVAVDCVLRSISLILQEKSRVDLSSNGRVWSLLTRPNGGILALTWEVNKVGP